MSSINCEESTGKRLVIATVQMSILLPYALMALLWYHTLSFNKVTEKKRYDYKEKEEEITGNQTTK